MTKKIEQLGQHHSTAAHKLLKDIMFKLIVQTGQDICFQCGGYLDRENYSIEHKEPWLDSVDPVKMFFDLDNIAFSHKRCNIAAARKPMKLSPEDKKAANDRALKKRRDDLKAKYTPEKRREKYKTKGY